ncbi:hypothetical protein Bbelb_193200 [Branchiostoma belcheri]|nr:hypothetical protein Bbelb_193200 [Branchiostoma belcheri]
MNGPRKERLRGRSRPEEKKAQRKHELEMEELKLRQAEYEYLTAKKEGTGDVKAKTPRLPCFGEGKPVDRKALGVYSSLSDADAADYDKIKEAVLKRYELTEDGFRKKFRAEVPHESEGPDQYLIRLSSYLNRERKPTSLEELGKMSDQYLMTHETSLSEGVRPHNAEGVPAWKSGQGGPGNLGKAFSKKNVVAQSMFAQGAGADGILAEDSKYTSSGAVNGNDYGAACVGSRAGPVTTQENKSELGEDKRRRGRGGKEPAVPRYQIPARRQQGGQVVYPQKAGVRSEGIIKQRIQKLCGR